VTDLLSRREWLGAAGLAAATSVVAACGSTDKASSPSVTVPTSVVIPTESSRSLITHPDEALARLMEGNARFVDATMQHPAQGPDHRFQVSKEQRPFAAILTCSDSRLPPEVIFDQGLGDLFVVRVAGNIVDVTLLGSVEYAVGHLGTPLVMVIGHERCGAVEATLESIEHDTTPKGDVAALVKAITPAVPVAEQQAGDLLDNTIRVNAEMSRDAIIKSSQISGPMKAGQLKVLAAYYNLEDGRIIPL
jgi:carbonic anhydrase